MAESFNPYPIVHMMEVLLIALIITVIALYVREILKDLLIAVLGAVWLVSLLLIGAAHAIARFETIKIDENAISHISGLLNTKRVVLSYAKISESKYHQNILQRIMGVGDLHIDSAGGSAIAIDVKSVRHTDLEKILAAIGSRADKDSKAMDD